MNITIIGVVCSPSILTINEQKRKKYLPSWNLPYDYL